MQDFGRQSADADGGAIVVSFGAWHGKENTSHDREDFSIFEILFDKVKCMLIVFHIAIFVHGYLIASLMSGSTNTQILTVGARGACVATAG